MKVLGSKISNSQNVSVGKMLNKPHKRLNSKKKHPCNYLKYHGGLSEPISNVSKRLIVKENTITVLLDTGSVAVVTSFSLEKDLMLSAYLL